MNSTPAVSKAASYDPRVHRSRLVGMGEHAGYESGKHRQYLRIAKHFRAGLMDLFRSDTSLSRPWSNRHDELSKDVTRGTERDRSYEMD